MMQWYEESTWEKYDDDTKHGTLAFHSGHCTRRVHGALGLFAWTTMMDIEQTKGKRIKMATGATYSSCSFPQTMSVAVDHGHLKQDGDKVNWMKMEVGAVYSLFILSRC